MKTTTKAIVSQTNHCRRLIAIKRPPAQTPLLGFPPTGDSTRTGDTGSTCTSVNKHLRECSDPQKWRNSGLTESQSLTVSPRVAAAKPLVVGLDRPVRPARLLPVAGPRRPGGARPLTSDFAAATRGDT